MPRLNTNKSSKNRQPKLGEWIGIAEAAKILDRSKNGVRLHIQKGNIRTRQNVYGFRIINEVLKRDCEKVAKTLAPRKFKKNPRQCAPIIEKKTGYLKVYKQHHHLAMCDGYVYLHRLIMEEKLGRPLKLGEIVHHLNGIRTDNRPENLDVVGSTGEHVSGHHQERIAKYGRGKR
jgi:hypothetical protein